jgi:hypothetical protein
VWCLADMGSIGERILVERPALLGAIDRFDLYG